VVVVVGIVVVVVVVEVISIACNRGVPRNDR
jgi:hypothetical protein